MEHTWFQLQISLDFLYLQLSWRFIFFKPKAPALEKDGKNICGRRQAKITFSSPYPFQGTSSGRRGKKDFRQTKITFSRVWPFQATNFADTSKRMTFSKQKSPFQILAPSNHPLWKNKHHFPNQASSPSMCSSQKQATQAICWAYMSILSHCFFLIVLPENKTKGHI